MNINMVSTKRIETIGGLRCRVWEGVTAKGIACFVFVPMIAVATAADNSEFEAELQENEPRECCETFDMRQIL